jgi:hypothetical protein
MAVSASPPRTCNMTSCLGDRCEHFATHGLFIARSCGLSNERGGQRAVGMARHTPGSRACGTITTSKARCRRRRTARVGYHCRTNACCEHKARAAMVLGQAIFATVHIQVICGLMQRRDAAEVKESAVGVAPRHCVCCRTVTADAWHRPTRAPCCDAWPGETSPALGVQLSPNRYAGLADGRLDYSATDANTHPCTSYFGASSRAVRSSAARRSRCREARGEAATT